MLPFCSWDDVAYVIYKTSGRITSVSKYEDDVYAHAIDLFWSNTTSCEENIFYALGT